MHRNKTMPEQQGSETSSDPEEYEQVLSSFEHFDPAAEPQIPTKPRRKLLEVARSFGTSGRSSGSAPMVSPSSPSAVKPWTTFGGSDLNFTDPHFSQRSLAMTSSSSTEGPSHPEMGLEGSIDEILARENRRLKEALLEMERQLSVSRIDEEHCDEDESDTHKLNRRIKSLKSKRKEEKAKLLQMEKKVKTGSVEIDGLQRELSSSLDTIDEMKKARAADKAQIAKLNKQLRDSHLVNRSGKEEKLETDLLQRDAELEKTQRVLKSKEERIMELQAELKYTKSQLDGSEMRSRSQQSSKGLDESHRGGSSVSSAQLRQIQAECRHLKRENKMLKLLVEELRESSGQNNGEDDLESVLEKIPLELQESASAFQKEVEFFNSWGSGNDLLRS